MTRSSSFTALATSWPDYAGATGNLAEAAAHKQYLAHYQLDFISQGVASSYQYGTLQVASFAVAVQSWQPLQAAAGTVYVVHGYWDHTGLYHHLIRLCLVAGFAVVAYDEPGHGLSTGDRAAIADFSQYSDVLDAVLAAHPSPDLTRIGIGQSTGGAVLLRQFFIRPHSFNDTILLAPLVRASRWHWLVAGHAVLSPFLKKFPRDMRVCGSHNPDYAAFLRADSLQYGYASGLWIGAMRRWVVEFLGFTAQAGKMLYIQGDQDDTVDWRFNLAAVRERVPQLSVSLQPGAYHNLVNEADNFRLPVEQEVRERLHNWAHNQNDN